MTEKYISERAAHIITSLVWAAYAAAVTFAWFMPLFAVILLTFIFVLDFVMHFIIEPRIPEDDETEDTSVAQDFEEFRIDDH